MIVNAVLSFSRQIWPLHIEQPHKTLGLQFKITSVRRSQPYILTPGTRAGLTNNANGIRADVQDCQGD